MKIRLNKKIFTRATVEACVRMTPIDSCIRLLDLQMIELFGKDQELGSCWRVVSLGRGA